MFSQSECSELLFAKVLWVLKTTFLDFSAYIYDGDVQTKMQYGVYWVIKDSDVRAGEMT